MKGRVLITGSSGFVGGALGNWLRDRAWEVIGLSRTAPRPGACDTFSAQDLSAGPPENLGHLDAIVHCAALASPWARPQDYESANIIALRHMLAFATDAKVKRFVFISSSAVHYVPADQINLSEDSPWPAHPINLYAASKRRGEAMVRESGLPWTIVRPRAVFGPGDTVVFPRILDAAKRGMLPTLTRKDGVQPVADLLFIDNLCWWIERILALDAGGVYLLANGEPIETPRLLTDILQRLGLPGLGVRMSVPTAMALARVMELASSNLFDWREPPVTRFGVASLAFSKTIDVTHALATLGRPPIGLTEGVERFVAWQAQRP